MAHDANTAFIEHLHALAKDPGAMAALRHSLAFEPGAYPRAYPYVERFVSSTWHTQDARRLARYAMAGLYALHPSPRSSSLAAALGELTREKDRPSLELRFIALLEADAEGVMHHLRQAVQLLAADGKGFDPVELLQDLAVALDERASPDARDRLKRRWARDFYRAMQAEAPAPQSADTTTPTHD
ncbi:MAG: type I-E CRISPR-associated protein Cse2/CasB [Burkholderiales bacterium]|nr:type I-E CRISPR-associated protein Cse2/CasB [Burkholderiales bacterium]